MFNQDTVAGTYEDKMGFKPTVWFAEEGPAFKLVLIPSDFLETYLKFSWQDFQK